MTASDQTEAAERSLRLRRFYAQFVTRLGEAGDPRTEQAFAAVPREPFVGAAPWLLATGGFGRATRRRSAYVCTSDADPAFVYHNVLIALDPDMGIHIGEPSLHARCLDALACKEGETVLHIGAGRGYYTAILADLVGPSGRLHAFKIDSCRAKPDRPWLGGCAGAVGDLGRPAGGGRRPCECGHHAAEPGMAGGAATWREIVVCASGGAGERGYGRHAGGAEAA